MVLRNRSPKEVLIVTLGGKKYFIGVSCLETHAWEKNNLEGISGIKIRPVYWG